MLIKKVTVQLYFLASPFICLGQELPNDASTSLLLHFNNTVNGVAGEVPVTTGSIAYVAGKHGQAFQATSTTSLRFDTAQNLRSTEGTIEFWIKPDANQSRLIFSAGPVNGMFIEVGHYTNMFVNTLPANPNPQVSVQSGYNAAYYPNTWYHLAFTWGNGMLKMYVNGSIFRTAPYNFQLSPIQASNFFIASSLDGNNHYLGLIDEFRISNRARTEAEICQSYTLGNGGIQTLAVRNMQPIKIYPTWNVYLNKAGWHQVPKLVSVAGSDSTPVSPACINWTVANTAIASIDNNILTAKLAGNTFLIGSFGNQSVQIPLEVVSPVLSPEKLVNIDPFLTTPASCYSTLVPVVAIVYLPTLDGVNIDVAEMGGVPTPNQSLFEIKKHIQNIYRHTKFSLEEGSKFRGYANPQAKPYLGYKVIDYIFVYEPVPRGYPENNQGTLFTSDYYQIMERHRGKYYIDTLGVKEIWLMGYHFGQIVPAESNMSSPTTGNISNSMRREDDMPKYSKTYVLYNYSMSRGGNEATHNHGHQIETMCDYVAIKQDGNTNLFARNFRGYTIAGQGPLNRCGDTHHPPNSRSDYDYENNTMVASDILDWKPSGGTQTMVNYRTWADIPYAWPTGLNFPPTPESNWYIMWMQSLPGAGNQIPYGTRWMTNWWRFLANWDSTTVNIGLHQTSPEPTPTNCFPTAITDLNNHEQIKIFPNPVQYKLIIRRTVNTISTINIRLFDMTGREMKRTSSSSFQTELDMNGLPTGNYVLRVEDKRNNLIEKKVITKQ